jgi:hypothetical protein
MQAFRAWQERERGAKPRPKRPAVKRSPARGKAA